MKSGEQSSGENIMNINLSLQIVDGKKKILLDWGIS